MSWILGTHWADPEPGQGRLERARELAAAVALEDLGAACDRVWFRNIELFIAEGEQTSPELRCLCAREMIRLSVLRRAIALAKQKRS